MAGTKRICSIPECNRPHNCRGWCSLHYHRWKATGDPLGLRRTENGEPNRFLEDVVLKHEGPECLKWPYATGETGYGLIHQDGRMRRVSRLVCERIHGPPPSDRHEARHLCGKGHESCCSPHHLVWGTKSENEIDKRTHGTDQRGSKSSVSKLTESDVSEIRCLYSQGVPQKKIAKMFNLWQGSVSRIVRRQSWAHL